MMTKELSDMTLKTVSYDCIACFPTGGDPQPGMLVPVLSPNNEKRPSGDYSLAVG